MASKIFDISRPVHAGLAVWPGDTPYSHIYGMQISAGETVNVSTLTMSAHTGSHADAPYHFDENGSKIDELPLDAYIGPATLFHLDHLGPISPRHLQDVPFATVERLLIRTPASDRPDAQWPSKIAYLLPETAHLLGRTGVRLFGIDSPSVDHLDSKDLPAHHALAQHRVAILENLYLRDVPPGSYELIALPLRIATDGSPVRAVLRTYVSVDLPTFLS